MADAPVFPREVLLKAVKAAERALVERRRPWGTPDNEFIMGRIRDDAARDVNTVLRVLLTELSSHHAVR